MRIVGHENKRFRQGTRTIATLGSPSEFPKAKASPSGRVSWRPPCIGPQMVECLSESGAIGITAKPQSGRPPKLTPARQSQVLNWLRKNPKSFGFATELWTARRVAQVIERKFHVHFNPRYLNEWLTMCVASSAEATNATTRTRRRRHPTLAEISVAAHPKRARALGCSFSIDRRERGFACSARPTHPGAQRPNSHSQAQGQTARQSFSNRGPVPFSRTPALGAVLQHPDQRPFRIDGCCLVRTPTA